MVRALTFFLVVLLAAGYSGAEDQDSIESKLYTGGLGANIYLISTGYGWGFDDFYRSDLYEPVLPHLNFEVYMQHGRFAALFELADAGVAGVQTWGLGLGYVLFDSRYLKVRPYARLGWSVMNVETRTDYVSTYINAYDGKVDFIYHDGGKTHAGSSRGVNSYSLAVDVDLRLASTRLFKIGSELLSFGITTKAVLTYSDISDEYGKGSGVTGVFSIGLGVYFW